MKVRLVVTELFTSGWTDVQDRRTDRYDKTNRRFSQFCHLS